MSGSLQSHDYVPGMSGLKTDLKTGKLEINSCTLGSAANAPERQVVSVEVSSYSKYDLPKNAGELLAFMQAELQKVPEEYRHDALFEDFDASYGDDSFSARFFLSYSRLETEQELAERLEKARVAGTRVSITNGCLTVTHDGVVRIKIGNPDQPEPEQLHPFKVEGGKVYISGAGIEEGSIANAKIHAAGFCPCMCTGGYTGDVSEPGAALKAGGVNAVLDRMAAVIRETKLYDQLRADTEQIKTSFADDVKDVIRSELRQGGLLWRRG